MSGYIYCLYSTLDGIPRYLGRTDEKVSYQFKRLVTSALDKEPGPVLDWIRNVWRGGDDVAVFTLQEGVAPEDFPMFEQYWTDQFGALLSTMNVDSKAPPTQIAQQVIAALQSQLELVKKT